jgi:hypothetical protein
MSENIDNMEIKIRLHNIAVVNAYFIVFLLPLSPHRTHFDGTERPHLTVYPMTGAALRIAIKETHQTRGCTTFKQLDTLH